MVWYRRGIVFEVGSGIGVLEYWSNGTRINVQKIIPNTIYQYSNTPKLQHSIDNSLGCGVGLSLHPSTTALRVALE